VGDDDVVEVLGEQLVDAAPRGRPIAVDDA
jgi:hypothetical protein